jgi:hypothetical protein
MRILVFFLLCLASPMITAQPLIHLPETKVLILSDNSGRLRLQIGYDKGLRIVQLVVNGRNTLSDQGVYSSVKTGPGIYSSLEARDVVPEILSENKVRLANIVYGDDEMRVKETWIFSSEEDGIQWDIEREYSENGLLEDMAMPVWNFSGLSLWKGGILNTGGVVWCKYLENINDTYGVHTNGVTFWEPISGDGFRVEGFSGCGEMACTFSHGDHGTFRFTHYLTPLELGQRYNLSRFVRGKADVFAPFHVDAGIAKMSLQMRYIDYHKEYDRGILSGIDAAAVRELLNTTARYGVVDKNITGANGWLTNWKCLHEPFFAQIAMALNDKNYTANLAATLDQERDQAIEEDGRVLARWHDVPEAEKSNYNFQTGYYDCPWGYTIDAQPSQVINTAELFHLTGDIEWLKSHKQTCEKVLDWLVKRDSNGNGIFEAINDNTADNTCSDWIDVVWASFENSFVNAMMYEALMQWAECERILNDTEKAGYYSNVALKLKEAFNKPVEEGGFWSEENSQYIYWRDKDGTLHGDNLVTPVNFAAIAFGICEDPYRVKSILDQIESRSVAENLFHWPLCFDSFKYEEVHAPVNWPFPNYENGDIFPTWGYLGIRSYTKYDVNIAMKYIRNLLHQYSIDGLSSQRFSRKTQKGIGEDILAGSSTTITALYRDIYGIRPRWNRLGLEPHLVKELNGTAFNYPLREQIYTIKLSEGNYQAGASDFTLKSREVFGIDVKADTLHFFPENLPDKGLTVVRENSSVPVEAEIVKWEENNRSWMVNSGGRLRFVLSDLVPHKKYSLSVNGKRGRTISSSGDGKIEWDFRCRKGTMFSVCPGG